MPTKNEVEQAAAEWEVARGLAEQAGQTYENIMTAWLCQEWKLTLGETRVTGRAGRTYLVRKFYNVRHSWNDTAPPWLIASPLKQDGMPSKGEHTLYEWKPL